MTRDITRIQHKEQYLVEKLVFEVKMRLEINKRKGLYRTEKQHMYDHPYSKSHYYTPYKTIGRAIEVNKQHFA